MLWPHTVAARIVLRPDMGYASISPCSPRPVPTQKPAMGGAIAKDSVRVRGSFARIYTAPAVSGRVPVRKAISNASEETCRAKAPAPPPPWQLAGSLFGYRQESLARIQSAERFRSGRYTSLEGNQCSCHLHHPMVGLPRRRSIRGRDSTTGQSYLGCLF